MDNVIEEREAYDRFDDDHTTPSRSHHADAAPGG